MGVYSSSSSLTDFDGSSDITGPLRSNSFDNSSRLMTGNPMPKSSYGYGLDKGNIGLISYFFN